MPRTDKINEEILKALAELLRSVKDPRVSGLVSLLRVETSPDLSTAKVYFSVLDASTAKDVQKGLRSAAGYLRRELGKRVLLRATPALSFVFDDSIAKGTHLLSLINSLDIKEADDENPSDD